MSSFLTLKCGGFSSHFFYEPLQGSRFLLQAEPALKCNFASKLVEVRGYSLFCDEKRIPSITPKRKGRFGFWGTNCSSLTSTFRLADTVSMVHANEVFSLEKTESKTKRFT